MSICTGCEQVTGKTENTNGQRASAKMLTCAKITEMQMETSYFYTHQRSSDSKLCQGWARVRGRDGSQTPGRRAT